LAIAHLKTFHREGGYCLIENDLQMRYSPCLRNYVMQELALINLPLGTTGYISRCLAPARADVYRLLEMGLCKGAKFTILHKGNVLGAIELKLNGSRLCIGKDLASQFLAIAQDLSFIGQKI
jgi:Fe2+ transport system protein FeoA